jgi:tetratricopeptide (TPR) repeat protein
MNIARNFRRSFQLAVALACGVWLALPSPAANGNGDTNSNEAFRSFLQLQEQMRVTQQAIERNRQEAETLAARNAETAAARFKALEDALAAQRLGELDTLQRTLQSNNRLLLIVAGVIASVGFLVLLLTAYLQWRSVSRLAEFSAIVQGARVLLPPPAAPADPQLLGAGAAAQSNTRLFGALTQLEKRILELEQTTHATPQVNPVITATGTSGTEPHTNGDSAAAHHPQTDHVAVLLAKGQSLLNLDKAAEALACFDEILQTEPNHPEALVKKGIALEELRQTDEALRCYDRAIAANGDFTIAYLQKGGLFNRLERYEEALQCYEQALHAQEKAHQV